MLLLLLSERLDGDELDEAKTSIRGAPVKLEVGAAADGKKKFKK